MRLTLRTLLAYLDDTLEPAQARLIGQKLAESEAALELVGRIKQVTRRRRLTVPPNSGPGSKLDPNTIAEYLDNVLPAEQLAEVEETCLASDVHLAEVATCHQILTLVLGEPMSVPPTARLRMYALKKGRESVSGRKAAALAAGRGARNGPGSTGDQADESELLGRLLARPGAWYRLVVPLTAVCLLVAAGFLIWMAMTGKTTTVAARQSSPSDGTPPVVTQTSENEKTTPSKVSDAKTEPDAKVGTQPEPKAGQEPKKEPPPETKTETPKKTETPTQNKPDDRPPPVTQVQPPRPERQELGKYILLPPSILLQQAQGKAIWQRVKPESPIYSTDYLVSLPGYRSELRLDSGVKMVLWGNLPEFSRIPVLESAVTLHVNPAFQADFTLDHGRVVLSNTRKEGPARVRLRFGDEVWDLTLADQTTEVAVELVGFCAPYTSDTVGGEPDLLLALLTLKGEAQLKIRYEEFLLSSPSRFMWDNLGGAARGPQKLNLPEWWTSKLPPKTPMQSALEGLAKRLIAKDSVDVAIAEMMKDADLPSRTLALRCLGAMGELSKLLDALNDDRHPDVADVGRRELLHFLGVSSKSDAKLIKLLKEKNYSEGQAQTVMQLLHGFSQEQWANQATRNALADYLTHEKLAIRHLSYILLLTMAPEGRNIAYNPTGDIGQRERAAEEWRRLLLGGKPPAKRGQKAAKGEGK
jgi:hypothetical protein